jgi:prepilin-type N-terminal cleavage/methylation domain-containing protein
MEMARIEMDGVRVRRRSGHDGFSLIEVMVAMVVLSVGLLALVGVFAAAVTRMAASSPMLVAREKAREAIESVHAARDSGELKWNAVNNVSNGGVFLDGRHALTTAGPDGLVSTSDDKDVEVVRKPGKNGLLGDTDDETVALTNFTREIVIAPLNYDNGGGVNPNLRQVTVNIRYQVEGAWRTYSMTTYVSSYS